MQDLQVIINESGLDKTKSQVLLDNFSEYFKIAAEWEAKAKMLKVTNENQLADMKMARIGRLELREKRLTIEKKRKELKEQSLREGKAIDGIANVLKAVIVPIEDYLERQEKFVEIREAEQKEAERVAAEKKAEEDRLENERLDAIARDRERVALPYRNFWTAVYNFREMSEANFESIMADLKKMKDDIDKEQARVRAENERLQKEAKEKEENAQKEREKADAERIKQEKIIADERAKAEAEKKAAEDRERKQREDAERDKRAAEKKAKEEKEKVQKQAEAKIKAERAEKERLQKLLEKQIECPFCHKKFELSVKTK